MNCSRTNSQSPSRFQAFYAQHRKTVDAVGYTAIALTTLAALGGALLLYMHLSGLTINQQGFTALWHRVSIYMNTPHNLTLAQIFTDIVAPSGGSALLILILITKAPQALWKRIQELRPSRRELRDQAAHVEAGWPDNVIESQTFGGDGVVTIST